MPNIIIYPYKMSSISAKDLAKGLDCKRVYPDKKYRAHTKNLIVNWGSSTVPSWDITGMLNNPHNVWGAANKLLAFTSMKMGEVSIPSYTTTKEEAGLWFLGGTKRIYCRTKLTGHSGDGIVVAHNPDELVDAPLYVQGICGYRDEYRVHIFNNILIDVQKKMKKVDTDPNQLIRNHGNGYVYGREGVELEEEFWHMAVGAVNALGLDFGAVDVVVTRGEPKECYVLEVNTAPGLTGTTLDKYVEAISDYYGEHYGE